MLIADAYINLSPTRRQIPHLLPVACSPSPSLSATAPLLLPVPMATPGQQQMPRTPQYLRCQSVLRINRLQQQQQQQTAATVAAANVTQIEWRHSSPPPAEANETESCRNICL